MRRALALAALAALWAARAMAAETIETGMIGSPNAPGWPWYIADQKGYFDAAGIKLDISYASTASGLVQQLTAGSLDLVADVGVVEPIHAAAKGAHVAMLRLIGQYSPYELVAKREIATVKDLKGKSICIGGLIDINRVYLERIMQANGLKDGDYDITVAGNTAARFAALKSGAVDASMLAPPYNFIAEDAGFHSVGLILDYAKDLPFAATVVSDEYAAKHRETLAKLVGALDKAVAWFDDGSNRDAAIDVLLHAMKSSDRPAAARAYDYMRKINYFAPGNAISRAQIESLEKSMAALGDTGSNVAPDKLVVSGLTRLVD
ncbi:MAG TPA: ABC transporter substrate-binding protein [Stellaceae bacterium]|nr:ABC transporter substrate-binding protein [Stellaceae bacterium]